MDAARWAQLPEVLVRRVLTYDGSIKYRRGQYVNQVRPEHYAALMRIPPILSEPVLLPDYVAHVTFSGSLGGYTQMQKYVNVNPPTSITPPWRATVHTFHLRHIMYVQGDGIGYNLIMYKTWYWYVCYASKRVCEWFA